MSDIILKFWPTNEVQIDKTSTLIDELKSRKMLGDEVDSWGMPAYSIGTEAAKLLASHLPADGLEVKNLAVFVKKEDYGIGIGEDDFEYINRLNVISVNGGDGDLQRSDEFCDILREITGDEYSTEFEIL